MSRKKKLGFEVVERKQDDELDRLNDAIMTMQLETVPDVNPGPSVPMTDASNMSRNIAYFPKELRDKKPGPAIIIGGGHSAKEFYSWFGRKEGTFACSGVPLLCDVKHWYSCDVLKTGPMKDWVRHDDKVMKMFSVESWTGHEIPADAWSCSTPAQGPVTPVTRGFWHGCSSAIGAIEFARFMGYQEFGVFGVDYQLEELDHPFDEVDPAQGLDRKPWNEDRVLRHWKQLADAYKDMYLKVGCCNPYSLLVTRKVLPYMEPHKILG